MSEQDNTQNIVQEHKQMTMFSGKLSDFQLENLNKWPFIVFNDLDSAKIEYDFEKKVKITDEDEEKFDAIHAGKIKFNLFFDKKPSKNKDLDKRIDTIKAWTKFLFWSDTKVTVNIKAKK